MDGPTFSIDVFFVVLSMLNFVVFIAVLYAVVRFARWLLVGRRRELADAADLRERVSRLEAAQGDRTQEG